MADTTSDAGEETSMLAVRRSGGVTGSVRSGQVDLAHDPRGQEIRQLLDRTDLSSLTSSPPQPDRFVYAFTIGEREVRLGEQDLTSDLSRIARLVLESGD